MPVRKFHSSSLGQKLPRHLAIRKEINRLPDQVLSTPSVHLVQSWYVQSLLNLMGVLFIHYNICNNFFLVYSEHLSTIICARPYR
uniref:Branched-chain alpha-ketoacid dehydrogenase kinase/Pyruvate dehydrogenase kinase N-terminal domain-containing protein n=1 Tax=Suricata suricatta TaxID=37032 RepID=A0A673U585_SURSU